MEKSNTQSSGLTGSFSQGGSGSFNQGGAIPTRGGPTKESFSARAAAAIVVEEKADSDRLDQIIRVDTNALLKIIRELEYSLTEHQRADVKPDWAVALEARLAIIEKQPMSYDSQPKLVDKYPLSEKKEYVAVPAPSIQELSSEDRIITKMRTEMEAKIEMAKINYESKLSSFSQEIDRLHKLLQIRPTTSELQQVVVSVHDVERKTQETMEDLHRDIKSTLNDKISEEMTSIYDQIKAAKSLNEHAIQQSHNTVSEYASNISEIRNAAETSFISMGEDIKRMKEVARISEEKNETMRSELMANMAAINKTMESLNDLQQETTRQIKVQKADLTGAIHALGSKVQQEHSALVAENKQMNEAISMCVAENSKTNENLSSYQSEMGLVIEAIKLDYSTTSEILDDQVVKVRQLDTQMQEIQEYDFPDRLAKHDEQFRIASNERVEMRNIIDNQCIAEIKASQLKIHHLEDICDVKLPMALADNARNTEKIYGMINTMDTGIKNMRRDAKEVSNLVDSLLPLTDQVKSLEDLATATTKEIKSLTETLRSTIDSTDELQRRLDENEEKLAEMDESITQRMNRIRDTLMDAMLEKQNETNSAVRNVTENLQAMGQSAGEPQMPMVSNMVPPKLRRGSKTMSNIDISGIDSARSSDSRKKTMIAQGPALNLSQSKYHRPSMNGAMLLGTPPPAVQRQREGTIRSQQSVASNASQMSAAGSEGSQQPVPLPGFSTSPQTQKKTLLGQAATRAATVASSQPIAEHNGDDRDEDEDEESGVTRMRQDSEDADFDLDTPEKEQTPRQNNSNDNDTDIPPGGGNMFDSVDYHAAGQLEGGADVREIEYMGRGVGDGDFINPNTRASFEGKLQSHLERIQADGNALEFPALGIGNDQQGQPESMVQHTAAEYSELLGGDQYQFHNQAQYISDLCSNYENISFKKRRVTFIPPVMCENIALVTQEIAEIMANGSDHDMVYNCICQGSTLQSVGDIQYDENFVLNRRQEKMAEYMRVVAQMVFHNNEAATGQPAGIVRQGARALFLSLVKKALEMFMSKHNQVLVVGNSRLGRVKIPSCIACDRPLIEKMRLDTVVSRDMNASSVSRGNPLGGGGSSLLHNSVSNWGESAFEDGGYGGGPSTVLNQQNNSLMLINIHNNNNVVGGNSIAMSRGTISGGGGRGASAGGQGKGGNNIKSKKSSLIKLPTAMSEVQRPRTQQGAVGPGGDAYVLRGGFKMPSRPVTSGGDGSMILSSSTPHLPDVYQSNNH